jgi:hypothetical protein
MFLIVLININPPSPILTHLLPKLYSILSLIAPFRVITPCPKKNNFQSLNLYSRKILIALNSINPQFHILTHLLPKFYSRLFLTEHLSDFPPCPILNNLHYPTVKSRLFLIAPITVIPPCPIITHLSTTLYNRMLVIAPVSVIPTCPILTYQQRHYSLFLISGSRVIQPFHILTQLSPTP